MTVFPRLVIEDDPDLANLLRFDLADDGSRVSHAPSGDVGTHLARAVGEIPQGILRALNSREDVGGQGSGLWEAVLATLDLKLAAELDTRE